MAPSRALLIVNRRSCSGNASQDAVVAALEQAGFSVRSFFIDKPTRIADLIAEHGGESDVIVLGGGDGTLNAAAAALVEADRPFGILPLGTANDLARTLEIPEDVEAITVIAEGRAHPIDLGRVNGSLFFNVATFGLGAEVARYHRGERKRRWRIFSYLLSFVDAFKAMRPFAARVTCDGTTERVRTVQVSVGNGRHYGGGMTVAEDAEIDDGWLRLFYVRPFRPWDVAALFLALRAGRHHLFRLSEVRMAREITVETKRPMDVSADGEFKVKTPARYQILPGAVRVLVPHSYLQRRQLTQARAATTRRLVS